MVELIFITILTMVAFIVAKIKNAPKLFLVYLNVIAFGLLIGLAQREFQKTEETKANPTSVVKMEFKSDLKSDMTTKQEELSNNTVATEKAEIKENKTPSNKTWSINNPEVKNKESPPLEDSS